MGSYINLKMDKEIITVVVEELRIRCRAKGIPGDVFVFISVLFASW